MSNIIDNVGFIILGIIAIYLLILLVMLRIQERIERKVKKFYNKGYNEAENEYSDNNSVIDISGHQLECMRIDYLKHKNQYCDDKNKQLENWILQERFTDDLQKMKDKADDFANQLEMQSTERDSKEFQRKLKIVK